MDATVDEGFSGRYSNTTVGVLVTIPYLVALVAMHACCSPFGSSLERRYHTAIPVMIASYLLGCCWDALELVLFLFSVHAWCLVSIRGLLPLGSCSGRCPTSFWPGTRQPQASHSLIPSEILAVSLALTQ